MSARERRLITLSALLALVVAAPAVAQVELVEGTELVFASVEKGKEILGTRDEFIERLSPFDLVSRAKVEEVTEETLLAHIQENVLEWTEKGKAAVTAAIDAHRAALVELGLPLPPQVHVILTTGEEDGGAPYTRGDAIVLPQGVLQSPPPRLQMIMVHELFHVLSRHNPELRKELYKIVGYVEIEELELPETVAVRKITNPDAPRNDHAIPVTWRKKEVLALPILLSRSDRYDVERGGSFFQYMTFKLLLLEREEESSEVKALLVDDEPVLADVRELSGFFEKIGHNTQYIIHAEEVLADNFVLLVKGETRLPSPQIVEGMREALSPPGEER